MIHPPKMITFVTALAIALGTSEAIALSNPGLGSTQPTVIPKLADLSLPAPRLRLPSPKFGRGVGLRRERDSAAFAPSGSDLGVSARSNAELTVEASGRGELIVEASAERGEGQSQQAGSIVAGLPPPPNTGTPNGQRTPGGSRPELTAACKQTQQPLTALVPEDGRGLTTAEHPVFWFYIPYAPKDIHSVEFSLHDQEETTTLYRSSLPIPQTPGVIGISLPAIPEHSLKLNQSYHWYFIVNCQSGDVENAVVLDGWVTRIQPSSNLGNPPQVWHDQLTNLAKRLLVEGDGEANNAWVKLLKSVGLEGLAQARLISPADYSEND